MDRLTREPEFAGQACGRFALGHAAEQEHQRGRALARAFKGRTAQQGIVTIASPAPIGVIVALDAEVAAIGAPTVRAYETIWVQVSFKPEQAQAIVKQLRDGKINHISLTPNRTVDGRQYITLARLLDMSPDFLLPHRKYGLIIASAYPDAENGN